jgi:hypothetical protein
MGGHRKRTRHQRRLAQAGVAVMIGVFVTLVTPRVGGGSPVGPTLGHGTQDAVGTISVWDGVYTEEQASRGQVRYTELCLSCHHEYLQGDTEVRAPALAGGAFMTTWHDVTVETLFETIYSTMPFESPGSLGLQESIDMVAYILQENGVPPGQAELLLDPGRLRRTLIQTQDGRAGP